MPHYSIPRVPSRVCLPLQTWERARALLESPGTPFLLPGGIACVIVGEHADAQRHLEAMRLSAWTLARPGVNAPATPSRPPGRRGGLVRVGGRDYVLDRFVQIDADVPTEDTRLHGVEAALWLSEWLRENERQRSLTDMGLSSHEIIDWMHLYQHPVAIVQFAGHRSGVLPYRSTCGGIDCVFVDPARPDLLPADTLEHHPYSAVA